jgi:subfamily B ATP-binding cassette protein HlyB/CyaB
MRWYPSRRMPRTTRASSIIDNLAFRYSEQHPWLYRNLNMRFKPGHLTVLMGPSGCGKSTLAKLLLGFYQPSEA